MRMTMVVALALLGPLSEVRTPKEGFACLHVQYKGKHYYAAKLERSRLTGTVTLTMPVLLVENGPTEYERAAQRALNQQTRKNAPVVTLDGLDSVVDSTYCLPNMP